MENILSGRKKFLRASPKAVRHQAAWLFFVFFLIFLPGCAGKTEPKPKAATPPNYSEVLDKWTRGKKIYADLDARLYMYATYKTFDFRDAYVDRYTRSYQLTAGYRQALLEREKEQSDKYNEFFFTAYTPESRWNDFDRLDSIWKLYLEDDSGNRLIPVSITKVDAGDPLIREFFPYFDMWSSGYIVRFPKYSEAGTEPIPGEKTKYLKLTVTGILGTGELEWRLKPL